MSLKAVGIATPHRFEELTIVERQQMMSAIADAGLDNVFFADHVSFRDGVGRDGMVQAAALSQLNPKLTVFIGIYLLALRHPVTVARQLATLAEFAPGRIVLGVGVGGEDRHEIEACGVEPRTRGRRTDECLQIVRRLLAGETVSHRSSFFEFDEVRILPPPQTPIPLVVGGRSDAALERTARYGDGWLALWRTPEVFAEGVAQIERRAAELDRTVTFHHGLQVWCGTADSRAEARDVLAKQMEGFYRVPFSKFERYCPYGTSEEIADYLKPFVERGCETINLKICGPNRVYEIEAASEIKRYLLRTTETE